jgi:hypothetical protein
MLQRRNISSPGQNKFAICNAAASFVQGAVEQLGG